MLALAKRSKVSTLVMYHWHMAHTSRANTLMYMFTCMYISVYMHVYIRPTHYIIIMSGSVMSDGSPAHTILTLYRMEQLRCMQQLREGM